MMMYFVTVKAGTQKYENQIARLAVQHDMQLTHKSAIGDASFTYQYQGKNVRKAHAFIDGVRSLGLYVKGERHSIPERGSPKRRSRIDEWAAELSRDLTNALNRK